MDYDLHDSSPACKVIEKLNRRALAGVKAITDVGAGGFDPKTAGACFPSANGTAWGVLLSNPRTKGSTADGRHRLEAKWTVAHVDNAGRVVKAKRASAFWAESWGGTIFGGMSNHSATYDFDGDGEAELVLIEGVSEHTGSGRFDGAVWTFENGQVHAYEPAPAKVIGVTDADCDGRPDLYFVHPFHATHNCSSMYHTSAVGRRFVAHSLKDGTFSLTDSVAAGAARDECDKRPAPIRPADAQDEWDLLFKVRCARLWGVSSAELEQQIQAVCKPPNANDSCYSKRPGVCVLRDTLLQWAGATPPLELK